MKNADLLKEYSEQEIFERGLCEVCERLGNGISNGHIFCSPECEAASE